jgi:Poly (ADP-ribose) glycohydrolase (PARG)
MDFTQQSEYDNLEDLEYYINYGLTEIERNEFYNTYTPFILFLSTIDYKTQLDEGILKINRLQCASIIARCFLNKFQNMESNEDGYRNKTFIDIFNKPITQNVEVYDDNLIESHHDFIMRMLNSNSINDDDISILHIEKIKFIMNYFHSIYKLYKEDIKTLTDDFVYFEKKKLTDKLDFTVEKPLVKVKFTTDKIEKCEAESGIAKVVFANKYIGGKVLSIGCCQEEIKFLTNPELLVGLILLNKVEDDEALVVDGTIKFSNYTGYGFDLKFQNVDTSMIKEYLIEIDAYRYNHNNKRLQYEVDYKNRDIAKAIIGFQNLDNRIHTIATGNWGCGAFNGDFKLKFLIQWYAASICNKELIYCIPSYCNNQSQITELTKLMEHLLFLTTKDLLAEIYRFNSR